MALTKPQSGVGVLAESPAHRRAAIIDPPLRPPDLCLGPDMLGLQLPRLLFGLPLQLARMPAGLYRCPRLQQVAADSHAHREDDRDGVERQLVRASSSVLELAVLAVLARSGRHALARAMVHIFCTSRSWRGGNLGDAG